MSKYVIQHAHAKGQEVIIGSSVVKVDEKGMAEVSEETYNSVAGLKNWTRFTEDGQPEPKETPVVASEVETQSDKDIVEDIDGEAAQLLKNEVARLNQEIEEKDARIEELELQVKDLESRLLYGAGKSAEEVNGDLKKAAAKKSVPQKRERGK